MPDNTSTFSLFGDPFSDSSAPLPSESVIEAPPLARDTSPPERSGGGVSGRDLERELLRAIKGSIILSKITEEDWDRLAIGSARRGVLEGGIESRKIRRSAADSRALDELCIWLNRYAFDVFFTVTFTDQYARSHHLKHLRSAVCDVRAGLSDLGFGGRFVLAAESTDREIPHVHGVLSSGGDDRWIGSTPSEGKLWRFFHGTRGRCRFELIRDQDDTTLYAFKDTLKNSSASDALILRMRPSHGLRNARRHLTEQESIFATRSAQRRRSAHNNLSSSPQPTTSPDRVGALPDDAGEIGSSKAGFSRR